LAPSRKFDPSHRDILLDPDRARYLDPKAILERFPIRSGDAVADIGSGPGFFTVPIAEIVGHQGRVYAIDVEEPMLEDLRARIGERSELRVTALRSIEDAVPLPDQSVDFAFMACVLHELEGLGTLREASRILRPAGALGIVDWKKIKQKIGPPREHRLTPNEAEELLRRGGFLPKTPFEVGPYHYGLVAHLRWARAPKRAKSRRKSSR
jgi:ubiquinone/menaquinone biosynthesis C-methylase UbiE